MFFIASKIVFALVRPLNLLILLLALGVLLGFTRLKHAGRRLVAAVAVLFAVIGFTPAAEVALGVLENRFPPTPEGVTAIDGIIVLGGALDTRAAEARPGAMAMSDAAERMTEVAGLVKRYPDARLIFTGGSGDLMPGALSEAEVARRLFLSFGIDEARMVFESRSRNTWENAVFTREIVMPRPDQRWLVVTSAFHMPRSIGVFRRAGWSGLVAYPTDFRTRGPDVPLRWPVSALTAFDSIDLVAKEAIGLVVYRLTGRSNALFPAP